MGLDFAQKGAEAPCALQHRGLRYLQVKPAV